MADHAITKTLQVGVVKALLETHLAEASSPAARATASAPKLSNAIAEEATDFLQLFLGEAIQRAVAEARLQGDSSLTSDHLEACIPQLLLDF